MACRDCSNIPAARRAMARAVQDSSCQELTTPLAKAVGFAHTASLTKCFGSSCCKSLSHEWMVLRYLLQKSQTAGEPC